MARKQSNSRPARWGRAVAAAQEALELARDAKQSVADQVQELWDDEMSKPLATLADAMAELMDLQSEFQEWYDNMPEGLQQGATGEKLEAISQLDLDYAEPDQPDFDFDFDLDEVESQIDEAEGAELPLGFGRD